MFELLFEDEDDATSTESKSVAPKGKGLGPPLPRNPTRFCGIENRGATCYLNSLLQTLLLTPELREALFHLGTDELGNLHEKDVPGSKVRVIPIELQRLFSRLLFLDQDSCSTEALTNSFGWNNSEHFQQHDVQELNRILFSAIEDSLVGTSGQNVISELYHGTIVNKIVCERCGKVSEREEDFLDLTLPVTGFVGVSDSLRAMYEEVELLRDNNQYKCSSCQTLVNAKKGAKLRKLPPILTLSLLRFSYDFLKGERYKETGHYTFPLELNMEAYCEKVPADTHSTYELFSVVIHSGSTHGGHYHAYIRDVEGRGHWFPLDSAPVFVKSDPLEGKVDFIEISSPQQLVKTLLQQHGEGGTLPIDKLCQDSAPVFVKSDPLEGKVDFIEISSPQQLVKTLLQQHGEGGTLPIDKLCQVLVSETGVSWNKRFKRQYGPITKFLRKYDDIFIVHPAGNEVSLRDPFIAGDSSTTSKPSSNSAKDTCAVKKDVNQRCGDSSASSLSEPAPGHCWFDFNDRKVQPVHGTELQSQFSGRESAYMLFYRQRGMSRRTAGAGDMAATPAWLLEEVQEANENLKIEREIHDLSVNEVKITVLQSDCYEWSNGALQCKEANSVSPKCLSLDRRKTVGDLKQAINETFENLSTTHCLHLAKELPAGLHLYECISENDAAIIRDVGIADGSMVFLWDGEQVQGMPIRTGVAVQPILLHLSFLTQSGDHCEISRGYNQDTSLAELHSMVAALTDIPEKELILQRMSKDGNLITLRKTSESILSEGVVDDDRLIAEKGNIDATKKSEGAITPILKEDLEKQLYLRVENRCCNQLGEERPNIQISISKDKTVKELKLSIQQKFSLNKEEFASSSCRLRVDDINLGLQPPLHECQTVESAGIKKNYQLVLEPGCPPKSNEVTVTIALYTEKGTKSWEMLLNRNDTFYRCLDEVVHVAGLESKDYHLCRTNWCWEEREVVTDMAKTLEEEHIQDGEHLLLKEGRLPPKGYIRCPVWLYPTPQQGFLQVFSTDAGQATWLSQQTQNVLDILSAGVEEQGGGKNNIKSQHALLGNVEVPQNSKLEELKMQIMTLPSLSDVCFPTLNFIRVRKLEGGRLSRVLSGQQTLRQLKVTSTSQLAIQLLSHEEQLKPSMVLLHVCLRIPNNRTYTPVEEFVWDTSKGTSPESLKDALSKGLQSIPTDRLALAKHLPDKYEWLVIFSSGVIQNKMKKGKKKGKPPVVNLKQGPYNLRDGDVIAVKDLQFDPLNKDDFTTEEDIISRKRIDEEMEEKRRLRREKKNFNTHERKPRRNHPRREASLSIKVEDFSQ